MTNIFEWEKLGLVFNTQKHGNGTWMHNFAQGPHVVQFEDFFRVYFSCRPQPDEKGQFVSYSAYVDFNDNFEIIGLSEKPIFKLGELGTFDEFGTYPVSTIEINEKYHAYYAGWTRCESVPFNTAIGMGISEDGGKTFEKVGHGPIISYTQDEPFVISGPKIRKFGDTYYLFYIAGRKWILDNGKPEPIYKIRMATSKDGLHFEKANYDLISSKNEFEAQASPDVFFKNGKYHMFFCYRGGKDYRGKENGYRIGYAVSDDLKNWNRQDEKVGITISEEGFDNEMISYPHIFERNNKIYMLYLGNSVGKEGFGAAILKNELL